MNNFLYYLAGSICVVTLTLTVFLIGAKVGYPIFNATIPQIRLLTAIDESNYLIDEQLEILLKSIRGAVIAKVALIQTPNPTLSDKQSSIPTWSIMYGKSSQNYDLGPLIANQPLSMWSDFLPTLIAGKCFQSSADLLRSDMAKQRLENIKINFFLVCPILNSKGSLIGSLFVNWPNNISYLEDTSAFQIKTQKAAARIAAYLEIKVDSRLR